MLIIKTRLESDIVDTDSDIVDTRSNLSEKVSTFASEALSTINRNHCPCSIGMTVHIGSEPAQVRGSRRLRSWKTVAALSGPEGVARNMLWIRGE